MTIEAPFAVGVYEITHELWAACADAGRCDRPSGLGPSGSGDQENLPVEVSWEDGREYVAWLSEKTGKRYRLLSEAEWEYVARAGTETARYWGESEEDQCRYANGFDETLRREWPDARGRSASCSDDHAFAAPVGSYPPNAFGLYDVLGNVDEWTQDCWHPDYSGAPTDGGAWETGDCAERMVRGGGWRMPPDKLRSAARDELFPDNDLNPIGIRVARDL